MAMLPVSLWVLNSLFTSTKVESILECPLALPPGAELMHCTHLLSGGWLGADGGEPSNLRVL